MQTGFCVIRTLDARYYWVCDGTIYGWHEGPPSSVWRLGDLAREVGEIVARCSFTPFEVVRLEIPERDAKAGSKEATLAALGKLIATATDDDEDAWEEWTRPIDAQSKVAASGIPADADPTVTLRPGFDWKQQACANIDAHMQGFEAGVKVGKADRVGSNATFHSSFDKPGVCVNAAPVIIQPEPGKFSGFASPGPLASKTEAATIDSPCEWQDEAKYGGSDLPDTPQHMSFRCDGTIKGKPVPVLVNGSWQEAPEAAGVIKGGHVYPPNRPPVRPERPRRPAPPDADGVVRGEIVSFQHNGIWVEGYLEFDGERESESAVIADSAPVKDNGSWQEVRREVVEGPR